MADELVIFVVRDNLGNAQDLGELVNAGLNKWALRSHDPLALPELQAIKLNTDQLEGFVDGVEGLLTSIRDNADTVETKLETLATSLAAINANTDQLEGYTDQVEALLTAIRDYVDQLEGYSDGIEGLLTTIRDNADAVETKLDTLTARIPEASLTSRMRIGLPAPGYQLWMDLANANHWYLLEAPLDKTASQIGFRGIRITLVSGNPVGKVEINESATLTFNNRTTDGGWS